MSIALKFKRAIAAFAAFTLFVSTASVAVAQTFNDVPTSAWYFDYVEQLVDDGVVDASDNYRPGDALNRAELVKMAVTAIDGLAGYEAPATPTFEDVPADAWFFDYVEAAVQLGIVNGYTDAAGNLTGMFGPSDVVNRAAATKILVNAFSVPTDLMPASVFPDVKTGAWFHDYVVTAYNQSILDGYDNGYFGPADPVTRAQVAKLVVNSQNPVERVVTGGEGEGEGEGTSEGDLEVSLNDDTAPSSTLPLSASNVDLASFDITAAADDVMVSNIVVTRGGVGQTTDWDALYLYDGAMRLTTGRTINSDTNTATIPVNFTVEAGTTTTISLVGDVAAPGVVGASNQHYFYIASASDVTSNAQAVSGDFPVAGNTFTMGGAGTVVNDVTVTAGTAPSQPLIGEMDAEIATLKLAAGANNDVAVHQLTLSQGGSLSSDKMVNCRLLRGTDEVATSDGFSDDRVIFVLDTPYVIPEGQTKTFYVNCDIDGGRSTDTIRVYLDENTDLVAIDQQYGFGATITNTFNTAAQTNTVTLKGGDVTVVDNGPAATQIAQNTTNNEFLNFGMTTDRDLTVRNTFLQLNIVGPGTGPNPTAVGDDTTDITGGDSATSDTFCVADAGFPAGLALGDMLSIPTSGGIEFGMVTAVAGTSASCAAGTAGTLVTTTAQGGVVATGAAITEVNPYNYVKNLRLVDMDSGSTLAGPLTDATSGATCTGIQLVCSKVHTEDFELTGGETRHLSVEADLDQDMAAGYTIRASVRFSDAIGPDSYIKDLAANEFVAMADIVGAGPTSLAGKFMTTATNSLNVGVASIPTSQQFVRGDNAVPALGISLTAGDAGDITVKRLTVRTYGDTGPTAAWGSATGDTAANTLVTSITLYDGNDVIAGPEGLSLVNVAGGTGFDPDSGDYYRAQFDDLNLKVSDGQTKTLTAKLKLLNTMTVVTYVAIDVVPGADIISEDDDANTITPTPSVSINGTTAHTPELTVNLAGSLTASSEGNPDADLVVAGATKKLVAKYRFNAQDEGYEVNKLTIVNDLAGDFGDAAAATAAVSGVTIKYTDINGVEQEEMSSLTAGTATFSGLDFYVPGDDDAFLEIYANVSSMANVGEALSGQTFRLGLQNSGNGVSTFEAVGASSSTTDNFVGAPAAGVTNSANIDSFTARKTVPKLAKVSTSASLANGERDLYGFTVSADAAGSLSFGRFVFDVNMSDAAAAVPALSVSSLKFYRGSSLIDKANIYCVGAACSANPVDASPVGAGTLAGDAQFVVSFNQEESISAGSSTTFYLKGTFVGVGTGDSVDTKIANGDESTALTGLTLNNNANTGRVYAAADATDGIFTAAATDFRQLVGVNRNVVWSDKSANTHVYPTITANPGGGTVTTVTGSYDWTNGYLLNITELSSQNMANN